MTEGDLMLGAELRELRRERDLTQAEMAALFHIPLRSYARYERNEYPVPMIVRHGIANQLRRRALPWPSHQPEPSQAE